MTDLYTLHLEPFSVINIAYNVSALLLSMLLVHQRLMYVCIQALEILLSVLISQIQYRDFNPI